jgi:hypothetical protein
MLQTAGKREDHKFEELIREFDKDGEFTVAIAWHLYVNQEPRPYNLAPVEVATKNIAKSGKAWVDRASDESAITRFPLSAFLAVSEGYMVGARLLLDEYDELREKHGNKEWVKHDQNGILYKIQPAHLAMQRRLGSMKNRWGAADE